MRLMKLIWSMMLMVSPLLFWACGGGGDGGGAAPPPLYTVSGTIRAAAGNQVDSDVNDTGTLAVANNSFSSAQTISVPGVVGGYVNEPGFGAEGNSYQYGDMTDVFFTGLDAGTTIRLALPDGASATVVLSLYDSNRNLVARDNDIERYAALSVESSGEYYIQVRLTSGASAYRLMVGVVTDLPGISSLGQSADFVPGEVLVRLKTAPAQRSAAAAVVTGFVERTGLKKVSADGRGWMRLRAEDRETVFQRLNIPRKSSSLSAGTKADEIRAAKQETLQLVQTLRRQPEVAHAQLNFIRRPYFTPDSDPLYPLQWHLPMLQLPDAWDRTLGNANVLVAVIDSGILSQHPDISGKIANGYDFISDPTNARDGDGIDPDPEDEGDGYSGDSSFHGTHTAGIIAAGFDNGIGVAGIGGATRIMPVRVLGPDGGTDLDIANAIRWAAGYDITDDIGNVIVPGANPPADIINMSLGGPDYSDLLQEAVADAYAAGVIMFAASGNTPDGEPSYPASFPEVFSVSAVDANGEIAYYSNFGPEVFVAAPGGDVGADLQPDGYADGVLSTMGSDLNDPVEYQYSYYQGTSMATANMSGVAALMKAARAAADPGNPLIPDDIYGFLVDGQITSDLGAVGDDDFYGYGLIDAYQAVLAAEAGDPPAALAVTPLSLRFEPDTVSATLYARKVGSGALSLEELTVGAGWLQVAQSAGQDGVGDFGQYTITVNRTNLSGGIYTDYIEFVTSANTVRVPVSLEVLPDRNASAATQYLLLIDADTGDTFAQQIITPSDGVYRFAIGEVPAGNYYLVSGSDLDNDYSLLEEGEAVGGYRTINDQVAIAVNRDMTGLNFVSGLTQWPSFLPAALSAAGRKRP